MKKYMKKILRILLYPLLYLNDRVKSTNWYKNSIPNLYNYPGNDWYRNHDERNYDVVNVGSSSGLYAFDYSETGLKAFNWALQPQSMEYSFKVLKNYFSILKKNGTVIIPFSPFSGLSVKGKWDKLSYGKYYHILDYTLIDNYKRIRRYRTWPLFYQPMESLKRLLNDASRNDDGKYYNVCHNDMEFEQDADRWVKNWMREFNITNLNSQKSEENIESAKFRMKTIMNMIDFCIERDLCPVIVIPPMHHTLARKIPPMFRENYLYSFINELNIHNIPFYDYMDNKEYNNNSYFYNAYFMNEKGAKAFTNDLLRKILIV